MYVEDKVTSIIINTYTCQLLGFLILLVSESLQALVLLIASSIHVAKATAFLATRLVTLPSILDVHDNAVRQCVDFYYTFDLSWFCKV